VGAEGIAVTPEVDVLIGDTPAAFAAQVVRLLRDPTLAERLRRGARELVERRYDYARLVEELEAGYRLAMADAARR
jgi:glycosyltransferase involved in cell wall biosynthesis